MNVEFSTKKEQELYDLKKKANSPNHKLLPHQQQLVDLKYLKWNKQKTHLVDETAKLENAEMIERTRPQLAKSE